MRSSLPAGRRSTRSTATRRRSARAAARPAAARPAADGRPGGRAARRARSETDRSAAAIRSGDLLFVSGQVGSREDGSPEPVFEEQVRLAFRNLAAVLEAAGCTFDDVVDVTTFHTDPAVQFEAVSAVRLDAFGAPPHPAWPAVGVRA